MSSGRISAEPKLEVAARLCASLESLAFVDGAAALGEPFGSFADRLSRLANDLPDCVGVVPKDESDGKGRDPTSLGA